MTAGILCEIPADVGSPESLALSLKLAELAGYRYAILKETLAFRDLFGSKRLAKAARARRQRETQAERELNAIRRQRQRRHYELNPHLRKTLKWEMV